MALEAGRHGAPVGTVIVADHQTKGRGRLQRSWFSPSGAGLYFSVLLRPRLDVAALPAMTLAAGIAVCRAIEKECGLQLGLKWPNDLLFAGKKLGGILCETEPYQYAAATGPSLLVIGIGLNVSTATPDFPAELRDRATSLAMAGGTDFSKDNLLLAILSELEHIVLQAETKGLAPILADWQARDACYGRVLSWVGTNGRVIIGIGEGIDDSGQYRVRDKDGAMHAVLSGDLTMIDF
jgi:BirA family biotin operon repressor/biotin-[acetyl-CoA-carboxylase] ligase